MAIRLVAALWDALAIIGFAHIFPWMLASISTIALGAAFVFEAGAVGARFSAVAHETQASQRTETWGRWSGMTAGFLAGCAGIALRLLTIYDSDLNLQLTRP
jgi:hypothetical protein